MKETFSVIFKHRAYCNILSDQGQMVCDIPIPTRIQSYLTPSYTFEVGLYCMNAKSLIKMDEASHSDGFYES